MKLLNDSTKEILLDKAPAIERPERTGLYVRIANERGIARLMMQRFRHHRRWWKRCHLWRGLLKSKPTQYKRIYLVLY